jgi:amidase
MTESKWGLATGEVWDAVETRERILDGSVSAKEVLEAAIARAEAAKPLGAIVAETFDRARKTIAKKKDGALFGVPTFIKDLAQVEGVPTAWGSRGSAGYVSRRSDTITKRIEETGLVTLGKSACPELGLNATTEPLGSAPCRNPWDTSRSSGGSSGGAAALVAAGVVPIAHATDGGGSIRIPASCCGLVGLKPSRFRLDLEGSNLLPVHIATDGVITRSVRDTIAFYSAIESRHPPRRVSKIGRVEKKKMDPLRIGVFVNAPAGTPVAEDVKAATLAAARRCETLGHKVDEIPCPFYADLNDDFLRFWSSLAWIQTRTAFALMHLGYDRSKVEPWTTGLIDYFWSAKRKTVASVNRLRAFGKTFDDVMKPYDVLVSPTLAEAAPLLGYLKGDQAFDVVFDRIRNYCPFTPVYNVTGSPAIALPLGKSAAGLPIGVQFAAAHGRDRLLLELALALEEAFVREA